MKLTEMAVDYEAIYAALEANAGELTPEIGQEIDALDFQERSKVDHLVFALKAMEGECDALKKLEDEISAKRKTKANARESLLKYVRWYMDTRQVEKLAGEVFRFQLVKSGKPAVEVLVPVEQLPTEWTTTTVVANKEAMRSAMHDGRLYGHGGSAESPVARLAAPTISVRIF